MICPGLIDYQESIAFRRNKKFMSVALIIQFTVSRFLDELLQSNLDNLNLARPSNHDNRMKHLEFGYSHENNFSNLYYLPLKRKYFKFLSLKRNDANFLSIYKCKHKLPMHQYEKYGWLNSFFIKTE